MARKWTTLLTLTDSELASETEKTNRDIFTKANDENLVPTLYDICIKSDLGDFFDDTYKPNFTTYLDNEGIEEPTMSEAAVIAGYDRYIESEVIFPRNGK